MRERTLMMIARVVSILLTPFYLPLAGLVALFIFSYMSQLPFWYKILVLLLVYLFTALLPRMLIRLYTNYHGWKLFALHQRERRMVPYLISIVSYFLCFYVMNMLRMPSFMSRIVVTALFIQILCAIINVWWKLSTHMAAIGGFVGALLAFAALYGFNPLWWLSLLLIISGILGTSRMILRQHSLSQIIGAFFIGLICAFVVII